MPQVISRVAELLLKDCAAMREFSRFLNYFTSHCCKYSGPYKEQLGGQWSADLLPKACAHNRIERNPYVVIIQSFVYLVAVNHECGSFSRSETRLTGTN